MKAIALTAAAALTLSCFCGCVSVPKAPLSAENPERNIVEHVAFLAGSELKGRSPGSRGATAARLYIGQAFRAYGLKPWKEQTGYEIDFGYGRNVVGVMPGSDPVLRDEFVLVSAHYDHLGREHGKVHPGAADNAAGVAVMLETARQLASQPEHPRRSVVFVAFDCEERMLLGAFAFSLRKEVQEAKIAAVINADILGRDFMDVVQHTLFVAGTEEHPTLREQVQKFGEAARLRVLPIGTDLIGPRSDHAAFETRGMPCLFFSSGVYKDYHQPTDTPEKLNYPDLVGSMQVVTKTTSVLANDSSFSPENHKAQQRAASVADPAELRAIDTVMSEVLAKREGAGIKTSDAAAVARLAAQAQRLLREGRYDAEVRAGLMSEAAGVLAPYFLPMDRQREGMTEEERANLAFAMRGLQHFYSQNRMEVLQTLQNLAGKVLQHRPGVIRSMPMFYEELYRLEPGNIYFRQKTNEQWSLHAMANWFTIQAGTHRRFWIVPAFALNMTLGLDGIDCTGTREQVTDFCLLRLREETNAVRRAELRKVLRVVLGAEADDPEHILKRRLKDGGFEDETEWLAHCIRSASPEVALAALGMDYTDHRCTKAVRQVILDRKQRGDVRAAAIRRVLSKQDREMVQALREVANDLAPASLREFIPLLSKDHPLAERPLAKILRPFLEQQSKANLKRSPTVGVVAQRQLKKIGAGN